MLTQEFACAQCLQTGSPAPSKAGSSPTETSSPWHTKKGAPVLHMQSSGNAADFLIYFILGSPFGWLQSFAIYVRNAQ